MLVEKFRDNCLQYENFAVWAVEDMDDFFEGNGVLAEILKIEYQIPVEEFNDRRTEIPETNMAIMKNILEHVADKHFFIFTYHNDNHSELVQMQTQGIMNFGLDIGDIKENQVYILMMDKKSDGNGFGAGMPL